MSENHAEKAHYDYPDHADPRIGNDECQCDTYRERGIDSRGATGPRKP